MSFEYRGLKAQLKRHVVTEEEIDQNLQRLQKQNPRITEVTDRPAALGDEVILDYAGFCNGEQFAGGTAENQTLVLGSGMFIPGFEEQLVGKALEEKVIVKVTFPEQYHSEELAGKDAEFHCVIHAIHVKTPYELDDVFAREVGGCENMVQMRQFVGQNMQAYADESSEMDLQDRLLRQAADTLEFTPSEAEVEAELDNHLQSMEAQLAQQGLNLEMYCQFLGTTREQLREDSRAGALQSVRMNAAMNKIAEEEKLVPTQEELDQALSIIASQNHLTMEQLKSYCDEQFEKAVYKNVLTSKVMRLIRDAADITVVE